MLNQLSRQLADIVEGAAPSVVQVQGQRRPASGLVYDAHTVVTTMRALGNADAVQVRRPDGRVLPAEFVGWDVATTLAVLRVPELDLSPIPRSTAPARVGELAMGLARSWSNAVTTTLGVIAVIGGPLRTSRHGALERVIRTTAPMHDGFSGGALIDADGRLVGITTATAIRGTGVVIPADLAWQAAAQVLEHGSTERPFLGVATQGVELAPAQRAGRDLARAVLVVGVVPDSPAAAAGVLVGDAILAVAGHDVAAPDDVSDAIARTTAGQSIEVRMLRGTTVATVTVTLGTRPSR